MRRGMIGPWRRSFAEIGILLAVWGVIIFVVNPVGEFMVNDDWAFVKALESFKEGNFTTTTGWGPSYAPGGPALITHLLWGVAWSSVFGYSLTGLRLSVLTLGILGSVVMLVILRLSGASRRLAFYATLTFVLNPLFFSQCFTFMTDVTFTSFAIFSVLFLQMGSERTSQTLVGFGLLFALVSILTRQIGIVIPLGFLAACLLHPRGSELGRMRMLVITVCIVLIPWLVYEFCLAGVGATPLTNHLVIHNILDFPRAKGFPDYLVFLGGQLLFAGSYTGFLVSPVLALRYNQYLKLKLFKYFLTIFTAGFLIFETALLAGVITPRPSFYPNVVFDFGIGPILLKDTYILHIQRTQSLPKPLFYLLAYWAWLGMVVLVGLTISSLKRLFMRNRVEALSINFFSAFTLLMGVAYVGIIAITGFHDRYLIPVFAFAILWLVSDMPGRHSFHFGRWKSLPAYVSLCLIASFSVTGVHDFMEMKRSLKQAHDYLISELQVNPCNTDGGFEFNGYHCYRKGLISPSGNSWWWVEKEAYLVSLGPLAGYRTIQTYRFKRYMGPDGAVHILQPCAAAVP
jgi:hypothetical protein